MITNYIIVTFVYAFALWAIVLAFDIMILGNKNSWFMKKTDFVVYGLDNFIKKQQTRRNKLKNNTKNNESKKWNVDFFD